MTAARPTRTPPAPEEPPKRALLKKLALAGAMICIVGCDQVTKHAATEVLAGSPAQSYFFDVLRVQYTENPGSFLSLGSDLPEPVRFMLFTVGVPLLVGLIVFQAIRTGWSGAQRVGLAVTVAGGVSNWMDRLSDGRVVDFLNLGLGPVRTGIFNLADIAILSGIVIWLWHEHVATTAKR